MVMETIFEQVRHQKDPDVVEALVRDYRARVARLAFEDPELQAACWVCGLQLARAPIGLACSCGIVVPVEERPSLPRYRFGPRVGQGAQGTVWKALYEPLDDWRAVKAIPLIDAEREARIREEARQTNALKHPNVPRVHDVLRDEDCVYISMEWIEGETLERSIVPSFRDAIEWTRQAAEGIGAAHARGVVHRDVKPGNLMLSRDGAIKVVDFGLAQAANDVAQIAGTLAYMAPEVARGEPATPRSDVWSLGATLCRLVTGRQPVERLADEAPPDYLVRRGTATVSPSGPPELAAVLSRSLALEPETRYATAGELAQDLARLLDGRPVHAYRDARRGPARWLYSLSRHVDRHPVATIVGFLLFVAATAMIVLVVEWMERGRRVQGERELLVHWDRYLGASRAIHRDASAGTFLQKCLEGFDAYLLRHPQSASGHYARGSARRLLDDAAGAEEDLRRAVELDPGLERAWALLELVRLERGTSLPTRPRIDASLALPLLDGDSQRATVREALAHRSDVARALLLAAHAVSPGEEYCLALAELATSPQEQARWIRAGLALAPGDPRLRKRSH